MQMMLTFCFYAQLLVLSNCLLDNRNPSAMVSDTSNAGLIDVWKELSSLKNYIIHATQEQESLQSLLCTANKEIVALKQKNAQYESEITELKGNQSQIYRELQQFKGIHSQGTVQPTSPPYQNTCKCQREISDIHNALSDVVKRLDILNNTDQLTNSELLMVRNEQKGLQRNQTEVKSMNNIMETEITDLVQQQNILKDTLANITAHLNTTVLDPINISDLRVLQSQFRYLSLSLNDLHINVSDNHRKTEAALSGIRSSLKHINGSEINLAKQYSCH